MFRRTRNALAWRSEQPTSAFSCALCRADAGTIIAACSQCQGGAIDFTKYAVGKRWLDTGVVSAGDMTVEATVAKLAHLMALPGLTADDIRVAFRADLRGERRMSPGAIRSAAEKMLVDSL